MRTADAAIVKKGQRLAQEGDDAKGILGCSNCHGPDGEGMPPTMPYLAAQYAQYIAFTLHMWKRGFRKNSPDMMAPIAKQLDDQEIAAVAAYHQQVCRPAGAAAPKVMDRLTSERFTESHAARAMALTLNVLIPASSGTLRR